MEVHGFALAIFLVAALQGLSDWARLYYMAHLGQDVVLKIRLRLFDHLMQLPFSFFDKVHTGDLISRVASDIETLSIFYTRAAVMAFGNIAFLLAILITMTFWDYRLAIVYLCLLPLIGHAMSIYSKQVSPFFRASRRYVSELTVELRNDLTAMDTIQGLGCEEIMLVKVQGQADTLGKSRIAAGGIVARWRHYPPTIVAIGCALCLWYGSSLVKSGSMSIGTLIGFTALFGLLGRPIRQTGFMLSVILRALAAAERVFELLDVHSDVVEKADAIELPAGKGTTTFRDVHFSYDSQKELPALSGVNTDLRSGDVVALVGPSGSGKTTLAHLIPRFYSPTKGSILIDEFDIADVTLKSLRQRVGIAFQDSFVFSGTLRDNVAWGSPNASDEEVWVALEKAQLADFVCSHERGLAMEVGERGVHLSGGQRQRLALARVLLYDPQILILDEPTASLDKIAEDRLRKAIHNVRSGRLTIVISHRLWTVRNADHIIVLNEGRIEQEARSEEGKTANEKLLAAGGLYAQLHSAKEMKVEP